MSNNLISVNNLKKSFGGLKAVDVQDLSFKEGELTSIIGPNGAGKTTFFDLISGFQNADSGSIFLKDKDISNAQPYKIARMGMVRTFQLTKVFDRMTVMENLLFSGSNVNNDSFLRSIFKLNSNFDLGYGYEFTSNAISEVIKNPTHELLLKIKFNKKINWQEFLKNSFL